MKPDLVQGEEIRQIDTKEMVALEIKLYKSLTSSEIAKSASTLCLADRLIKFA